ncbi:MAG: EVE domain-containing protein, partial [Chloroflexota bacterium]|nr:EVE domain-containing protein [Chloroflexota bacterium]MED6295844.1 EVE domain-containing protein [Chloroflexota bacterium]
NPIWFMVDIKADLSFETPVSLQEIKTTPALSEMVLVKNSRLSVQPVKPQEFDLIVKMGTNED